MRHLSGGGLLGTWARPAERPMMASFFFPLLTSSKSYDVSNIALAGLSPLPQPHQFMYVVFVLRLEQASDKQYVPLPLLVRSGSEKFPQKIRGWAQCFFVSQVPYICSSHFIEAVSKRL